MKTLNVLAFSMLLATVAFSQSEPYNTEWTVSSCDSTLDYRFLSGDWALIDYHKNVLFASNFLKEMRTYDPVKALEMQTKYTRDANNHTTLIERWLMVGSSLKKMSYSDIQYDANNALSEETIWVFNTSNSQFEKSEHYVYTTDNNNNVIQILKQSWDGNNWNDVYHLNYSNMFNGKPVEIIQEDWKSSNSTWFETKRQIFNYSTNGKVSDITFYTNSVDPTVWVNSSRLTYTYDSKKNLVSTLQENWNSGSSAWDKYSVDSAKTNGNIVYQYNGSSWDPFSKSVCTGNAAPSAPLAPNGLTATSDGVKVILNWNDNSDNELGFIIYRSDDDSSFLPIDTTAANSTSYTDNTISKDNTYWYQLRAYNNLGPSGFSNKAQAMKTNAICYCFEDFHFYPNPTSKTLFVQTIGSGHILTISLSDLFGNVVYQVQNDKANTEINVADIRNGIYLLRIKSDARMMTTKVLIQH